MIALDENGFHSFSLLQTKTPLHFYVFDLLYLGNDERNTMRHSDEKLNVLLELEKATRENSRQINVPRPKT